MIIKNWMQKDPITISSDTLASEATKIFDEHRVRFIPVVDEGTLRGILPRRDLRHAASWVTATQSIHEVNFFNTRLKVKDLMVRQPITLSIDDTVETALTRGAKLGRTFFPVMEGEKLVGTTCDMDIFNSLYQILGVGKKLSGITLDADQLEGNDIKEIVQEITLAGGALHSLFTLKLPDSDEKRLVLRFEAEDPKRVMSAIEKKGYRVVE
jgi:acetoin utilization protein AcuB